MPQTLRQYLIDEAINVHDKDDPISGGVRGMLAAINQAFPSAEKIALSEAHVHGLRAAIHGAVVNTVAGIATLGVEEVTQRIIARLREIEQGK